MNPIEIIALIVVIISIVKLVVILIKPAYWMKVVKPIYNNYLLTMLISFILFVITLYYVTKYITIVEIMAVTALIALTWIMTFTAYNKEMMSLAQSVLKDRNSIRKSWLVILIWLVLIFWAAYHLVIFA